MRQPLKTRTEFPATEGWVVFQNDKTSQINVVLEPWGIAGSIQPGERAHVHIVRDKDSPPTMIVSDGIIQIYCADAMYQNSVEVIDFMN